MELKRKIAVITGGACKLGSAWAQKLIQERARVITTDKDETCLKKIPQKPAIPMVTNFLEKPGLKLLVDKTIYRFGRTDLIISPTMICEKVKILIPDNNRSMPWHRNVMSQMSAAKYLLPHMTDGGIGYLGNVF